MEHTAPVYALFVGIDIAATTCTIASVTAQGNLTAPVTFDQSPHGFTALQQHVRRANVAPAATLVVLEATSTYWVALAVILHDAGYCVSVVNPLQAHHFAKAQLRRAKTDNIDAQDLAHLAAKLQPPTWSPPPAIYHEVRQRLMTRDALLTMRQQTRNQRHALLQWPVVIESVRQHLDIVLTTLDQQIAALDVELVEVLTDGAWNASFTCLMSIPGIGTITAAWLLMTTINFTLCATPDAATAYAGLAPMPRESGSSLRGRPRIGHAGNGHLRTALYMATLSAARYNPAIKTFYTRLRGAGKPAKVARCAAARKLLHLAWALVTKQQHFNPLHQQMQLQPVTLTA